MSCIIYNNKTYTNDEFANFLLEGGMETLANEKKISTSLSNIGKEIKSKVDAVNAKYNRKLKMELFKKETALNSSEDLIKLRNFLKKDPAKNTKLSEDQTRKQAGLSDKASVNELKNRLASINIAWRNTQAALKKEQEQEIKIVSQQVVSAKDKFSLKNILRKMFNLKKNFKTTSGTVISEAEAAATIMDKVLDTIAKRRSIVEGKKVSVQDIYNSTFYKKSTPEEIINSLFQLIGKKGIENLGNVPQSDIIKVFGNDRYELSDEEATFNFDNLSNNQTIELFKRIKNGSALKDILFHDKLFQAYPELMNIKVRTGNFQDNQNRGHYAGKTVGFDAKTAEIVLNLKSIDGTRLASPADVFITLIHEIQHAIQHIERVSDAALNYEGFANLVRADKAATALVIKKSKEAQQKNVTLNEVLTDEDKNILEGLTSDINITGIPESDFIASMEEHLTKLNEITKGDVKRMYLFTMSELEARATEARLELDEEMKNLIPYMDTLRMDAETNNQGKIYKDEMDAFFTIVDSKTPQMLFQNTAITENNILNKLITNAEKLRTPLIKYFQDDINRTRDLFEDEDDNEINGILEELSNNLLGEEELLLDKLKRHTDISTVVSEIYKRYNSTINGYPMNDKELNKIYYDAGIISNTEYEYLNSKPTRDTSPFDVGLPDVDEEFGYDKKGEPFSTKKFNPRTLNQEARAAYQQSGSFSTGVNGKFDILKEGQDLIHAITDPNVSSPVHEIAHKYEKYLTAEERKDILEWAGTTEWTRETSEKFARGFEKYLASGEAPSSALKDIFEAFKTWLTAIYEGIIGSEIDIELNDKMKSIYAQMLGENFVAETKQKVEQEKVAEPEVIEPTPEPIVNTETQVSPSTQMDEEDAYDYKVVQLSEVMYAAKNRISNSDDTEEAMAEYNRAKKEYEDFKQDHVDKRRLKGLIFVHEDTVVRSNDDIRLDIIVDLKDSIDFFNELLTEKDFRNYTEEELKNRILENESDITFLQNEILKTPYSGAELSTEPVIEPTIEDLVPIKEQPPIIPTVQDVVAPIEVKEETPIKEEAPVTEINGWSIGDTTSISGSNYTVVSFKRINGEYYVEARQLGQANFRTQLFPVNNMTEYKEATRIVAVKKQETPVWIPLSEDNIVEMDEVGFYILDHKTNPVNVEPFDTREEAITEIERLNEKNAPKPKTIPKVNTQKEEEFKGEAKTKFQKLDAIASILQSLFPSLKYEIKDYPNDDWAGRFHKGIVQINLSLADKDVVVHEFMHPFVYVLSKENPTLYKKTIEEMKRTSPDFYKNEVEVVKGQSAYNNLTKEEIDEEILVRFITEKVSQRFNEDGVLDEGKDRDAIHPEYPFITAFVNKIVEFMDKLKNYLSSMFTTKTRLFANISAIEYSKKHGTVRIYFNDNLENAAIIAMVGKDGEQLTTDKLIEHLSDQKKLPLEASNKKGIAQLANEIVDDIKIARNKNDELDIEEELLTINFSSYQVIKDSEKNKLDLKSKVRNFSNQRMAPSEAFSVLSEDTTIDQLSAFVINHGILTFDISSHQKAFEKLSDRYYIKSKDKLIEFSDKFRKQILNLQHTLEKRLKSTELTQDLRNEIISNLTALKPLTEKEFLDNDTYIEEATNVIRTGFLSLMAAERMMASVRTRINYGDIKNYVDALEQNLIAAGINVVNGNNYYGVRIHKNHVEINKKQLIKNGFIPTDISKYIVGKPDSVEDMRKRAQRVNSDTISTLKKELTQEEIQELNIDISAMRNYYATFKGFTKSLLDEYSDQLDNNEVMEFSNALQSYLIRMRELETDMRILAVEWLFPYFDTLQNQALSQLTEAERKEKYVNKEDFTKLLRYANEDSTAVDYLFGAMVNTKDPLNATVGIIISDIVNRNTNSLGHLVSQTASLRESYFVSKGIKTSKARAEYIKANFLRKAKVYEVQKDEHGNLLKDPQGIPVRRLVERWALHTPIKEDELDLALDAYINSLDRPIVPEVRSKQNWEKYQADVKEYHKKIEDWKATNIPLHVNQDYQRLVTDPMFQFLWVNYDKSNAMYGEQQLKYGIIPQSMIVENFINKKKSHSILGKTCHRFSKIEVDVFFI